VLQYALSKYERAVAMTLYTYLCDDDATPIDSDDEGDEVVSSMDETPKLREKVSVAFFVNKIGGELEGVMEMMRMVTAMLLEKGIKVEQDCDAIF
jgi:hypothetical protein